VEGVIVSIFGGAKVMKVENGRGAHDDSEALLDLERHIKATTNLSYEVLKEIDAKGAREASWRLKNWDKDAGHWLSS
jgi:hypothetical protein